MKSDYVKWWNIERMIMALIKLKDMNYESYFEYLYKVKTLVVMICLNWIRVIIVTLC